MKKSILVFFLFIVSIFGNISLVNAQCYGNIVYDQSVAPAPTSSSTNSFTINTTHCNELILISYDGFDFGSTTGTGPITVDGNNATYLNTSSESQGGIYVVAAETYAYIASTPGVHNITVNENGYSANSGYDINFAADFYAINTVNPITIASLTSVSHGVACESGGPITGTINTTIPNSMIYDNTCYNDVDNTSDPISWTNGTFLADNHAGYGIEGSDAYTSANTTGAHSITADNSYNANDCTGITMVLVAIPPPLCGTPLTATDLAVNPTCGNNNGSITITASGGDAPYTYTWSPNVSTTNSATGLSAGTYSITVGDAACDDVTLIVTLSSASIAVSANVTANEPCNGECVGSATSTIVGGTAPFTYNWTPSGGSNSSATGLCAGTYTVTVTDHTGCTGTARVTITQPTAVTATMGAPTDPACNGGTGSVTVTAGGGTSPYTYSWNPSGQTNAMATGLSAGTYTVTVKDHNGCTATASVTISQPALLTANTSMTQATCGSNNGTATVIAGGGTSPYTYSWNPSGQTNQTATGLTAGTYTVTVKDHNGCTATSSITVTSTAGITVTMGATTGVLCNGGNTGSATVNTVGGSTPYTYSWNPSGQTNQTATGLSAGTYTVTVTDHNGCTGTATATITQPALLTATMSPPTYPTCNGGTGSVTVTAGGGTSPYTYSWNPSGQTNAMATGLSAGTYTVTVTDHNGCTASASIVISQPGILTATMGAPLNPACNGGTGSATVTAGGGTPNYSYNWTPSGGTNATGTGLTAGTYTVTVTDHNGCTATASVTITQPTLLIATMGAPTNISCNGGTGSATVTASGGTLNYSYNWTPSGGTNATGTGLTAGSYTVTVRDANGCTATASVTITQPAALTTTTSFTHASCNLPNGSATVNVLGGTNPYIYSWNPSGQTNSTATGLSAGTYTVTVTDHNGCTTSASVTVTQPSAVTATMNAPTDPACNGGTGSLTVTAGGGTAPYTYSWNPSGQTNATATGLSAGSYTVTVTDANGCTVTASATITQPTLLTASIGAPTDPSCHGGTGSATVTATGGTLNYSYNWTPSGGTNATGTGLTAGTYTVSVRDAHGCTATAFVTITQPAAVTATMSAPNNVPCNGGTGSANVIAGGGTGPYYYSWNPSGQTTATALGLSAGTYTVTVRDANGCTGTASVIITQPPVLMITTSFTHASCNLPNGTATANATGGTSPYAYSWNPSGQTTATATGLNAGTYTITVTDNNHCTASASVTVTQPSVVTASISATTGVSCNGGSNGTATALAGGGTAPYNYVWSPGGNTNAHGTGLPAGTYTMTITDANGCTASAATTVTEPATLAVSVSGPQLLCTGTTGSFTANVTGGTMPYAYSWSSGQTTSAAAITPDSVSTFTVTVTDANGCNASGQITVSFGPPLTIAVAGQTSICGGKSATLCATATGGLGGNTYTWQPGNLTTPCITVSPASTTTYTVTVKDNCGASVTQNSTVHLNPYPAVNLSADIYQGCAPLCIQFRNTTVLQGGAEQYVWTFGNGDTSHAENPVYCYPATGTYNVSLTVTSDSGCSSTLKKVNIINVFKRPDAAFTTSPQTTTIMAPTIQFTDKSAGEYAILSRLWNFGDGSDSSSSALNPSHTYRDTGNYCATLVVTDAHGCTDTATNCLVIEPAFNLYIPSAFTPNGDGMNDVFQPVGKYIKSFEMYIFDRWGSQVFHSSDINKGWNGTVNGGSTVAQQDTYIYKILVTDSQGNEHSYVGNISLMK